MANKGKDHPTGHFEVVSWAGGFESLTWSDLKYFPRVLCASCPSPKYFPSRFSVMLEFAP